MLYPKKKKTILVIKITIHLFKSTLFEKDLIMEINPSNGLIINITNDITTLLSYLA